MATCSRLRPLRRHRAVSVLLLVSLICCTVWAATATVATQSRDAAAATRRYANATDGAASPVIRRHKRYLDFLPLSRMFFRANIKDNVLKWNNLWAQAYGYRANFVIENRRRMKRSEVYDTISELISQHGFDGRACILKSMCEASKALTPDSGIVFRLFKLIFSPRAYGLTDALYSDGRLPAGDGELYPYLKSDDCAELGRHCPLSFLDVSPFTDE